MELIKFFAYILTVVAIGWNILYPASLKGGRLSVFERLFISYGLGSGAVSLEMFCFHFFTIKFSILNIIAPWAVLFIINLGIYFRTKELPGVSFQKKEVSGMFVTGILLSAGIIFEIAYAFFRALIKPIEAYDAVATYAIRSKIFYLAKSIPQDFFYNLSLLFPHPDYPLNIPLSETFAYLFMGTLNDQLVKIIFPLYFVSLLGILYFAVRRFFSHTGALLFTFILATIPQFNNFATNAYHDVPFAYYCFAGMVFLILWLKDNKAMGYLYISAAMTALSAWTKNEGFVYCAANIMLIGIFLFINRRRIKAKSVANLFLYIGLILLILAPWLWVKYSANLVNSDVGSTTLNQLNIFRQSYKIWPIFYEFQRQVFGPKKWNIIWIALIALAVIYHKKLFSKEQRYVTISLILVVSGYVFAYMVGTDDIWHMVGTTWSRMLIHFLPLSVYWLAVMLKDEIKL